MELGIAVNSDQKAMFQKKDEADHIGSTMGAPHSAETSPPGMKTVAS